MSVLQAFHDDPAIKARYLNRVRAYREAGRLEQGSPWTNGAGGAIACTVEGDEPGRYVEELGLSVQLAHLEEGIFDGLHPDEAQGFPEEFLAAIPEGIDADVAMCCFVVWLLSDEDSPMGAWREDAHIREMAELFEQQAQGGQPPAERWAAAKEACQRAGDEGHRRSCEAKTLAEEARLTSQAAAGYAAHAMGRYVGGARAVHKAVRPAFVDQAIAHGVEAMATSAGWYVAAQSNPTDQHAMEQARAEGELAAFRKVAGQLIKQLKVPAIPQQLPEAGM